MRLFWPLMAGAGLLAVAALSTTIALHSGGNPGTAAAITATPVPEQRAWRLSLQVPEDPVAGSTMHVSAKAFVAEPDVYPPGAIADVSYQLWTSDPVEPGNEPVLEVVSDSKVSVDDVLDGAEWDLRALSAGQAAVFARLTYTVLWCDTCNPFHASRTLGRRIVDVLPLPGDVNCDVQANSIDAALILQLVALMIDELPCQDAAYVNRNGGVSATDATLILQFAAGLLDTLAIEA